MNLILAVCIGNICRSPMAEALLATELPNVNVASAGIGALVGKPADPMACQLMSARGIDISPHIAKQLNQDLCRRADLILVMDLEQKRHIESAYPFVRGKVYRLADSINRDVPDPYKRGEAAFEQALDLIDSGVQVWVERIKKISKI